MLLIVGIRGRAIADDGNIWRRRKPDLITHVDVSPANVSDSEAVEKALDDDVGKKTVT